MKLLKRLGVLAGLCLALALPTRAQLALSSSVTAGPPGLFHYSYNVFNGTPTDYSVVTLAGLTPGFDTIQSLSAPTGFLALFDTGLGLLSFVEDSSPFVAGTWSGAFTFDSPFSPNWGSFEGISIAGDFSTGTTVVPGGAAVPEPSTYGVGAAALLLAFITVRKFRHRSS